ncbi:MerR family transcriptional regulator [Lysinibacillus sp. NPDC097195]|uniref:MerR family transcriptional regulator n=1 Tax=Lysinibacillus sp. NPDC097195 TaxID=3364141 RepID=UPI003824A906
MKIGEFALCTGLSKDTIRYYEKINLLHPIIKNNQREYHEQHVEIIHIILKLKQSGFLLQEIKMLFELSQHTDHTNQLSDEEIDNVKQLKLLFQHKYDQMVQKEEEIRQIKQVLSNANHKIEQLLEKNSR